jgi:hypothetical protein
MKISLILIGSVSATALAGIAVAQARNVWPQLDISDLERCRPVIAQVHRIEQSYIRDITTRECNAPARFYSTESCRTARRWLSKTESQDDIVWYFEGNDRCQGTDYPCFGVKIYNTVRSGAEARRWAKYFMDKSAKPFSVTRGMDLWSAAREADTCVSGVWASKFRMANMPSGPDPTLVADAPPPAEPPAQAAESAPAQVAESAAVPPSAPAGESAEAAAEIMVAATDAAAATATTIAAASAPVATTAAIAADKLATAAVAAAAPETATTAAVAAAPPPAAVTATLRPERKKGGAGKETMQAVIELIAEGKNGEAIALGDKIAASQPAGDGQLTACKTRVLAKQDLDKALVACYSTGKPSDPAVLETRGQVHLLAGRHQDAWNDFNAALSAKESNATLYLRGLASAGMGKTVDALKDLATAEAGEKGIMAAYESKGYTLANVMAGKPLVDAAAMAAAPVPAVPAAAPAEPVEPAATTAAGAAAPAPAPTADEPIVPLPNAVYPPADAPAVPAPTAVPAAPAVPVPNKVQSPATQPPAKIPDKLAAPTTAKPEAPVPVSAPEPAAGSFAASTGSAVAVPGISLPAVTDCLVPVAPASNGRGAFKNKCNYPVRFTYCNIKGAEGIPQLTCGSDTKFRAETIGGNGSIPATLGLSVAYFACRSPTLPEVIYTSNNGLEGYCR